jgi:hypothetical protein
MIINNLENYEIHSDGRVVNINSGKEVVFCKDNKGYRKARLYTNLSKNKDGRKPYRLHRLVAMAFLPNFNDELQVNHKDGDKNNNDVSNLEMVTCAENVWHAWNVLETNKDRRKELSKRRTGQKHSQETKNKISEIKRKRKDV